MISETNSTVSSSIKNLQNELSTLEYESVRFIPQDFFYIIKTVLNVDEEVLHSISNIVSILLNSDPKPCACYHSFTEKPHDIFELSILLIFPSMGETHQLEGNHNLIVSKYTMMYAKLFHDWAFNLPKKPEFSHEFLEISTTIIHFESNIQLITYISLHIYNVSRKCFMFKSKGSITNKEINFRTDNELENILNDHTNESWNEITSEEKYGVLSKIKRRKKDDSPQTINSKGSDTRNAHFLVSQISELFDTREYKKYINFIFS